MMLIEYLYSYALLVPGREPFYLPATFRPGGIGYPRNISLEQPPGSETTFILGDGTRKIEPLTLKGQLVPALFEQRTEDSARLWLESLDAAARACTGVQRGQTIRRSLHAGGYMTASPGDTPLHWDITLTLYPTGPSWADVVTGRQVPF